MAASPRSLCQRPPRLPPTRYQPDFSLPSTSPSLKTQSRRAITLLMLPSLPLEGMELSPLSQAFPVLTMPPS